MIDQCEKCALYNSLGCPYDYESASKDTDCDEFRPNEENKITDPIKRQLFKLLKDSPSLNVLYEEEWTESVEYLVANGVTINEVIIAENEKLKKLLDDRCDRCIMRERVNTAEKFAELAKEEFRLNTDNQGDINSCYVSDILDRVARVIIGGETE